MNGTDAWINLLVQVPLVGIFVWFTLQQQKSFQAFLKERDDKFLASLEKLTNEFTDHDERVNKAITTMEERTRPRGSRKDVSHAS